MVMHFSSGQHWIPLGGQHDETYAKAGQCGCGCKNIQGQRQLPQEQGLFREEEEA
jgi:hypothetical protein